MMDFKTHMDNLDNQIKNYMPQQNTPLYDALVKPKDIFSNLKLEFGAYLGFGNWNLKSQNPTGFVLHWILG